MTEMIKEKRKISSSPLCLISALAWGISFPVQEMASRNAHILDSFGFNGLRMLLGSLVLIPVVLLFERNEFHLTKKVKSSVLLGALAGLVLFTASSLQQYGIQLTGESGKAGFITSLYLIFVSIFSFVFFKEKPTLLVLIAMPISLVGLYFLSFTKGFGQVETGDLLLLACAVMYATHIMVLDRSAPHSSPLLFSCVQFFVAGVLGLIFGGAFGTVTGQGIVNTWFPILFSGVFSVAVAYTCQLLGQKNGNATVCALFCSMEALFAVIAECIMEKHLPTLQMVIGCSLMLIAVILAQLPKDIFKKSSH